MGASLLQVSASFSAFRNLGVCPCRNQSFLSLSSSGGGSATSYQAGFKLRGSIRERWPFFLGGGSVKDWNLLLRDGVSRGKKRMVVVRLDQNSGLNRNGGEGGGGGGGKDNNSTNSRLLGNLAVPVALTLLSITGQLGWVLDAIVSIWILVALVSVVGFGVFLWWVEKEIVQSSCPNCGNDFQIFKSALTDELQLCPFCSQPFSGVSERKHIGWRIIICGRFQTMSEGAQPSHKVLNLVDHIIRTDICILRVVGDKFVRDPVEFFNQPKPFGQAFSGFSRQSKKGKDSSSTIVDVQAEVVDAD